MSHRFTRRAVVRKLAFAWATTGAALCTKVAPSALAASALDGRTVLIMVDDPGCIYCLKWEREVEGSYRNSAEGSFAPVEKRRKGHADLAGLTGLNYTPTFVLLRHGAEIGRIVGYAGSDWFWGEIEPLFRKAGYVPENQELKQDERRT
ncbi:MAG: thioredoxin fold domain-containing protein [Hyphomicrobiaceae bacterium]